jgi:hypothetical protein
MNTTRIEVIIFKQMNSENEGLVSTSYLYGVLYSKRKRYRHSPLAPTVRNSGVRDLHEAARRYIIA